MSPFAPMGVLDASVALKLVLAEDHSDRAEALVTATLTAGQPVSGPPSLPLEVRGSAALIWRFEDDAYWFAAIRGASPEMEEYSRGHPTSTTRGSVAGRVYLERRPVQVEDVLADAEFNSSATQRLYGFRTLLGVPTAEAIAAGVWSDLTAWCGDQSHHDDTTLLVLRVSQ